MKGVSRVSVLTAAVLAADQLTKTAAFALFAGRDPAIFAWWGFTYTVEPGLWAQAESAAWWVVTVHLAAVVVWLVPVRFALKQRRVFASASWHRSGRSPALPVDAFVAVYTTAIFGALLDRLLVGGARHWLVTPFGTTSLSTLAALATLALALTLATRAVKRRARKRSRPVDALRW
jgi:hypothetical protein